jgi:cytoskeletal protein CcmA (bactofilin family)
MIDPAPSRSAPSASSRRSLLAAFALILLFGVVALPAYGTASDTRTGDTLSIGSSEQLAEDLYVAAGSFEFSGRADGDVSVAAGDASVGGRIGGSVMIAAATAEFDGTIAGSLRILGGRVRLAGEITGDVLLAGGQLELARDARIGGSLILAGGDVDLDGQLGGDVRGWIGDLTVRGQIDGAVDVRTSSFTIHETARVTGPVTYASRTEANVRSEDALQGGITRENLDPWGDGDDAFSRASGGLLRTMWALVAGVMLVALAPRLAENLGANARRLVPALPLGLLALLLVPVAGVVLIATVIGIPAGAVLLALYVVALYLTQVVVGMAIGRLVLPRRWNDGSRGFHLLAMTIGVLLIGALRFIPLPYVHGLVMLVVTVWGMGAFAMLAGSRARGSGGEVALAR